MFLMEVRHNTHPSQLASFDTAQLRGHYLVENLFQAGEIRTVYSHADRAVLGGAAPLPGKPLRLAAEDPLRSKYFCERRELAIVVVSGKGRVQGDGYEYTLGHRDCLYIGRGTERIEFHADAERTHFYLFSTSSHANFPSAVARYEEAKVARIGSKAGANERTIRKFIHMDGIRSSQLVLGITTLSEGSVWNTMAPHTHDRRTECYLYFDLPPEERVIHLLGEPKETRNLVVANEQAVISPSWSIHCGAGTHAYSFVWAMGGENQAFDDMDPVAVTELR
ncbi:5-dehydro-4-deoxy-D-glucuronate isomerase [Pendulispora brunnea]|uniref:5-dehydro-4-deoxy-D-glucuronate isomerase n=1 Tax=Pendulispora brunnea TaxID=2905690 RepID=A0ABZ2K4J5_9BACT